MNLELLIQIVSAVTLSLGGGSAIVLAATKWCGNILSKKLLKNIQYNHEKEIEKYKADLQETSAKLDVFLQNSMHITQHQYDMEIEVYKKIWSSLYKLLDCLKYVDDFENVRTSNEIELINLQNKHYEVLIEQLRKFEKNYSENAPFYQKEAYESMVKIGKEFQRLGNIFEKCKDKIILPEKDNSIAVCREICQNIEELKDELIKYVREYLNSLKNIA